MVPSMALPFRIQADFWRVSARYEGAVPLRQWCTRTHNRNWILSGTRNQCSSRRSGVRDRDIVTNGIPIGLMHALHKFVVSNDLEWLSKIFNDTKDARLSAIAELLVFYIEVWSSGRFCITLIRSFRRRASAIKDTDGDYKQGNACVWQVPITHAVQSTSSIPDVCRS